MAAKAAVVPICSADIGIWRRFQSRTEHLVTEGNIVAGERLWELVPSSGQGSQLVIRSIREHADCVECAFDLESSVLTCLPGSAIGGDPLVLKLLEGTCCKPSRDTVECTIDQAVAWILDKLIWIEDDDSELPGLVDSEGE